MSCNFYIHFCDGLINFVNIMTVDVRYQDANETTKSFYIIPYRLGRKRFSW